MNDPVEWLLSRVRCDEVGTGCCYWTAGTNTRGYGKANLNGKPVMAHRVAYQLFVGPIPDGLTIDHLCRVRGCVNPLHLEPVTRRENTLRGYCPAAVNLRKQTCQYGHEFYVRYNGKRACRICWNVEQKEYHRRRRAALRYG